MSNLQTETLAEFDKIASQINPDELEIASELILKEAGIGSTVGGILNKLRGALPTAKAAVDAAAPGVAEGAAAAAKPVTEAVVKAKKFPRLKAFGTGALVGGTGLAAFSPKPEDDSNQQRLADESMSTMKEDFEKLAGMLPEEDLEEIARQILTDMG